MFIEDFNYDENKKHFKIILEQIFEQESYRNQIRDIIDIDQNQNVIEVNLDDIREQDKNLFNIIINKPSEFIKLMQDIFRQQIKDIVQYQEDNKYIQFHLNFKGQLGKHSFTPRGLKANQLNKLIKVEGIVTFMSKPQVRLLQSAHFCEKTQKFTFKEYDDKMSMVIQDKSKYNNSIPLFDEHANALYFEYGISNFKDFQLLGIQEKPENVPSGHLSRNVQILLQNNLVDRVKPGDRVQIIGILKPIDNYSSLKYGLFQKIVIAYDIFILNSNTNLQITPKDINQIKQVSKKMDLIDLFARSLSPSIYGREYVKEALVLQLLGGDEVNLENKGRIRGDINVLLIGDPSTGKSQFLRKMLDISYLSFNTTGKGSSGVGLTAAVVIDKTTGERRVEAGTMVLADRGLICIDEFDKMNKEDQVAMHEAMEQQTVTIAKAGICMQLNARCKILAAANPIYGEYVTSKPPSYNLGLNDTLLSRFDLIFIILDENKSSLDKLVAQQVTYNHKNYKTNLKVSKTNTDGIIEQEFQSSTRSNNIYQQNSQQQKGMKFLSQSFLKKYINYASQLKPQLIGESSKYLSEQWTLIRQEDSRNQRLMRVTNLTIRSLESLIRLSTAYAKLRLSKKVEKRDCVNGINMFLKAQYGGYENLNKDMFIQDQKLLKMGRKIIKKPTSTSRQIRKSKKKKEPSSSKKYKREINRQKKLIYKIIYQFTQEGGEYYEEEVDVTENMVWEFIHLNCPSSQYNLRFGDMNEFVQILTELEKDNKIVIDKNILYLIQLFENRTKGIHQVEFGIESLRGEE